MRREGQEGNNDTHAGLDMVSALGMDTKLVAYDERGHKSRRTQPGVRSRPRGYCRLYCIVFAARTEPCGLMNSN